MPFLSSQLWVRHFGPWGDVPQTLSVLPDRNTVNYCSIEDGKATGWVLRSHVYCMAMGREDNVYISEAKIIFIPPNTVHKIYYHGHCHECWCDWRSALTCDWSGGRQLLPEWQNCVKILGLGTMGGQHLSTCGHLCPMSTVNNFECVTWLAGEVRKQPFSNLSMSPSHLQDWLQLRSLDPIPQVSDSLWLGRSP